MPLVSDNLYPSRLPPRIPLLPSFDSRSGSPAVDSKLVNGFMEKDQSGDWWVNKRAGLVIAATDPVAVGSGQGLYYWETTQSLYSITSDGLLRKDYSSTVGSVDVTPLNFYEFNETQSSPRVLFMKNRTEAYTLTSTGTFAQVVSADYPGMSYALTPGSAYLNGTTYVFTFTGEIYGSAINDPSTWDPLNMIRAQIEPDTGVAIAKQGSYVVAFKTWTTEFFYDAGAYNGTLTGSPLLPVQNAKLPMGCIGGTTVQSIDDVLFFVGRNKTIGPSVYAIVGAKLKPIGTPAVDKLLAQFVPDYSWQVRLSGHTFYLIRVPSSPTLTLAYDITSGVWQIWTEGGVALDVLRSTAGITTGVNYLQGSNGAIIRSMSPTVYYDTSLTSQVSALNLDAVTPIFDAGSNLGKVLSKLRIVADQNASGSLEIRWSDDDYKTWTNWIVINLRDDVPFLTNLGRFTKRAFQYRHSSPTPFRMAAFEVDLLLGSI